MNPLTPSPVTIRPLASPTMTATASTTARAIEMLAALDVDTDAVSMAAIVIIGTTERSIDPATITNVWPHATMPRATERTRMFSRLKLPPSSEHEHPRDDQDEGEQNVDAALAAAAGDLPNPPETR